MTEEKTSATLPLTYGAIISISQPTDENLVMYSEGMIKTQVYLEDISQNGKEASFYRSLFQIYPSFINTYKKEALNLKASIENGTAEENKLKENLNELKEKLTMEYKFNLEYYEKVKGTHIAFDQSVQFLHLASNKFLACSFKEADVEKENYKLELEDIPSEATNFKISPSYKHQKDSEGCIYFGDLMFIAHATYFLNKIPYIHCSYQEEGNTSLIKNIYAFETHAHNFGDERVVLDVQKNNADGKNQLAAKQYIKREINVSLELSTRWRINLFAANESEMENFLAYGNIIWMNHVESNASMIAKKQDDLLTIDFARTVVSDHFQQYVGNTNGMWIIENEDHLTGGPIHCDDKFRLKHFSSGKYLSVTRNPHKKSYHLTLDYEKTKESLFQFVMVYTNVSKSNHARAKLITKETFTRIKSFSTNCWVSVQLNDDRLEAVLAKRPLDDDIFKLFKSNNSEIWETSFIISCYPTLKEFINFLETMSQQDVSSKKVLNKFKEAHESILQLEQFCTNKLLNTSPDQKYGEINPFRQKVLREQYFLEVLTQILKVVFKPQELEKAFDTKKAAKSIKKSATNHFKNIAKKLLSSSPKKENDQQIFEEKTKICKAIYSLLKNICKSNPENELYAYKLIHDFQYHARYFQEAVDCFVSIIGPNQTILSSINEDTDVKEVQKDLEEAIEADLVLQKKQVEIFNIKVIFDKKNDKADYKPQNFVTFFLSLLKSTSSIESNKGYLKFLRSICTCKNKGISPNQEWLFKIFSEYKDLEKSVFLPVKISAGKIEIGIDDTNYISLNDYVKEDDTITNYQNEINYFKEQLKFYSDLLLDRNYLWKNKLEKQFPLKFVFEQVYNDSLSLGIRSIFCSLAFTLYIDHEPLNSKVIPNLCRIFKSNHLRNQPSLMTSTEKLQNLDQENFSILLENLMRIIKNQKSKISERLDNDFASNTEEVIKPTQGENFLDNVLLASVISLLSKMTRYDLLTILNKNNFYYDLVNVLMHILEYEKRNPSVSYVLAAIREDKMPKEAQEKKGNVINAFGGFMGDLSKGVVGNLKNLANNVFGNTQKKKDQGNRNLEGEAEDSALFSHPIMKGLIDIKQQLDQLVIEQKKIENSHEIIIKEEICNLFCFLIDLRQDFLVSNTIGWYDNIVYKFLGTPSGKDTIPTLVDQEVKKVLPKIPKTGVKDIDDKFSGKLADDDVLSNMKDILKKSKQALLNAPKEEGFVKFTEDAEIPDLDTLFTQNPKQAPVADSTKPILPSLLTTFYLCNDTNLQNKLLTVIMRMYNQKQELAQNLTDLEVIFQKKNIAAYHKLEAWITNLRLQTETSEIWLDNFISSKGENGDGVKKVCELLTNIQMLFSKLNPRSAKYYQSRQNMIRNMSGFTPMIELVRDGIGHLKKALATPFFPEAALQKLFKMFQLIHSCLICFAMNNEVNQEVLSQNMRLFLSNLELDLGQIPLICEICRDNKMLCETFADLIMNNLTEAIVSYGHKITFLEPLTVLQSQKGIVFVDNQIKILDQFLPTNSFYKEKEVELLYANDETGQIQFQFQKQKPLDQPFLYHAQLFNILVPQDKASEQLSFIHARLRKIFNVPYCISLLLQHDDLSVPELQNIVTKSEAHRQDDHLLFDRNTNIDSSEKGYSILKPKILELLDILYLKSDKKLAQEFLDYIQPLTDFLNLEQNRLKSLNEDSKLDSKLIHYILECLIPFLNSYVNKLIKETSEEVRERRGNNVISAYVHILYEKAHILTAGIPKHKQEAILELFSCYYEEETAKSKVFDKEDGHKPGLSTQYEEDQKTPLDFNLDFDDNDDQAEDKANFEKYEELWGVFLPHFLNSQGLEKELKDEKTALSEAIWNFRDIIPEEYKKKFTIDFDEKVLLKKLIMFLQYGIAHKAEKVTMISTLKVLRTLIEEAPDMTEMQNVFDRNDATTMLLSVFSDSKNSIKDDDLMSEFLSFWISLLEGGNLQVQKTIYKFCTVFPKSEVMFAKFHSIIYEEIEYLQMKKTMKNDLNSLKNIERAGLKSVILEKLLRLLQLFTEGHNLDLQNYLRHQTNSRNRFNMVEAVIELLRIYYEDLVQENYENIVRCLDTLNELVQGPCPENQIVLIDGKFFEVATKLLEKELEKKEKKKLTDLPKDKSSMSLMSMAVIAAPRVHNQNRPLERWMLARLKYKVLILINSLLEMRTSDTVIRRIMRSLPLEILKTNLVKVFRRYKKAYGLSYTMDAFKHFDGDPRKKDAQPAIYYENILESGFLIYFLISSYLEANVQDIDLQNEIQEMQEGLANSDQMLQEFLKNNVVGQLGRFGYSFLRSGIDSLSVLKKQVGKKFKGKEEIIPKEEEKKFRKAVEYRQLVTHAMDFFSKNSAHIEVVRNKNLEKVYFIVLPFCKELPKETKNHFNEKVNRQSPQTKVSDLIESSEEIIKICKHELRLKLFFGRNKLIAVFANFVNLWKDLAFFMTLLLNLFILGSYSMRNDLIDGSQDPDARLDYPLLFLDHNVTRNTTLDVFLICGIIMAVSSVFVVIFFLLKRAPLIFDEAWKDEPTPDGTPVKASFWTIVKKIIKVAYLSLQSVEIIYYIAYGVLAVIGTVIHPFFFAFHLTEILIRYPTLKNVIKAVWEPRQQLGLTFLLYLILNYIFSLIAFQYFADYYQGDCETTWLCFLNTYDFTWKANGGIGGHLDDISPRPAGEYESGRFFFDYFFNTILVIIMINIVAGIIIDTFGLLREEEEEKNKDIEEICFICGLGKEVFDRQADTGYDFNIHIKKDHYMWNYVFFVAYLEDKDETEYTGIESYISERLKNSDFTSWFPFHKALALKVHEEDEEDNQKEIISAFQSGIEAIKKGMKEITTVYSGLVTKLSSA